MSDAALHRGHIPVSLGGEQPRIGPNAFTRVAEALAALEGPQARDRVFSSAGLVRYLRHPPGGMVPDEDVALLHAALAEEFGAEAAQAIGAEAGRLTARYLLAHRIPRAAQAVLRLLPADLALRLLLKAIGGHAWTFAGAGAFGYRLRPSVRLTIAGGPVSRYRRSDTPVCAYYAATFETLFRAIVSPGISVVETECEAMGGRACVFELRWS